MEVNNPAEDRTFSASTDVQLQHATPGNENGLQTPQQAAALSTSPLMENAVYTSSGDIEPGGPSEDKNEDAPTTEVEEGEVQETCDDPVPASTSPFICPIKWRTAYDSGIRDENVRKFWRGAITEPYAAPAVGYGSVLDNEVTSGRARADARILRLAKSSMELTLARIEEFGLENIPKRDTFIDALLQENDWELSEDQIREMEARQAICQRHISLWESGKSGFVQGYNVPILFEKSGARGLRNFLAHQCGNPNFDYDERTLYAEIAEVYREALVGVDNVLLALEEALYDASRWSDSPPPDMSFPFGRGFRIERVNIETSHDMDPTVDEHYHTEDPSDTIENDGRSSGKFTSFFRKLFGLNTSRTRDVETGDGWAYAEGTGTHNSDTWIMRSFEYIYYRSNWTRGISYTIYDAIGNVSNRYMEHNLYEDEY